MTLASTFFSSKKVTVTDLIIANPPSSLVAKRRTCKLPSRCAALHFSFDLHRFMVTGLASLVDALALYPKDTAPGARHVKHSVPS